MSDLSLIPAEVMEAAVRAAAEAVVRNKAKYGLSLSDDAWDATRADEFMDALIAQEVDDEANRAAVAATAPILVAEGARQEQERIVSEIRTGALTFPKGSTERNCLRAAAYLAEEDDDA